MRKEGSAYRAQRLFPPLSAYVREEEGVRGGAADDFRIFSLILLCRLLLSKQGKTNAGQDLKPSGYSCAP